MPLAVCSNNFGNSGYPERVQRFLIAEGNRAFPHRDTFGASPIKMPELETLAPGYSDFMNSITLENSLLYEILDHLVIQLILY